LNRSTANSAGESIDHPRTCREDFGIERNQSFKETTVTHNSVFAAQSTAMPDDDLQDRHPAFCLYGKIESGKQEIGKEFEIRN
jgi:hypothetical protein